MFGSWDDLEKVAAELDPTRRSLPILVAGTGLRPEEWLALERRDLDLKAGALHVRRVYTDGQVKEYGKQDRSLRRMPLRRGALDALEAHPWRLDTPVVYPGDRGGYLSLHALATRRVVSGARVGGSPPPRPVFDAPHVRLVRDRRRREPLLLARLMGSSVEQIDRTYGHLLPDSEEYLRGLLDEYDGRDDESTDEAREQRVR